MNRVRWAPLSLFLPFVWAVPSVRAAEPMMDGGLLGSYRSSAPNLVTDGLFTEALEREQRALRIASDQFGEVHPNLAPILEDLGTLERILAHYPEAEKHYRWALALQERTYGLDDPRLVPTLTHLGALGLDLDRDAEASVDLERARNLLEKAEGPSTPLLVPVLRALARVETHRNSPAKAQAYLERCQRLEGSPNSVETLEDLARTLLALGQGPQAVELAQRALELRQKAFPEASPEVGRSLQFLGDVEHATGSSKDRENYETAAKIRDRLIGPDLYSNIPILAEASRTDLALGRFAEAGKLLDRVLALRKKYYGPQHPLVAFDLEAKADLEAAQDHVEKARDYLKEAKVILVKVLGADHSLVRSLEKKMAGVKRK